jgi:Protein of unknown function (DUF4199)
MIAAGKNAVLSAGLTFAWMLAEFFLGWHTAHAEIGRYTGALALVFPVWLLWRSLKVERAGRGGAPGFGRGAAVSLVFGAVASLVSVPLLLTYYRVINPAFAPRPDAAGYAAIAVGGIAVTLAIGLVETALLRRKP